MAQRIKFKVEMIRDIIIFSVEGALDLYTLPKFKAALDLLVSKNLKFFILDFFSLDSLDKEAVRTISDYSTKIKLLNGLMVFSNIKNYDVISIFNSNVIIEDIKVFDDNNSALDSFVAKRDEEYILDLKNLFYVGQNLEFYIELQGIKKIVYLKVISSDHSHVVVEWPRFKSGEYLKIAKNTKISGKIMGLNSIYIFKSKIFELSINPPCLIIEKPLNFLKDYKRNYTRVEAALISTFQIFNSDGTLQSGVYSGKISNISGGGCQLITNKNIKKGTFVHVGIRIGNEMSNSINAKVVRISSTILNDREVYELGLHFTALFDQERRSILKYVLTQQENFI